MKAVASDEINAFSQRVLQEVLYADHIKQAEISVRRVVKKQVDVAVGSRLSARR